MEVTEAVVENRDLAPANALVALIAAIIIVGAAIWSNLRHRSHALAPKAGLSCGVLRRRVALVVGQGSPGPQPRIVIGFACSAAFIGYWSRSVLSIAILSMANELKLGTKATATALSAFFYGYIAANLCSAKLLQRRNPRWVMLGSIVGSSFATAVLPLAVAWCGTWGLIAARALAGLLQGMLFPAIYSVYSSDFASDEALRTRAMSMLGGMPPLGVAANFLFSPLLVKAAGWELSVIIAGLIGLPWSLSWYLFIGRGRQGMPASPEAEDLSCSETSMVADAEVGKGVAEKDVAVAGVREILRAPAFYAVASGHFVHSWMTYMVMAWLPLYMREEHGVSGDMLAMSCVPYAISAIASPFLGTSASNLMKRAELDLWASRRCLGLAALLVPAFGVFWFPQIPSSWWPLPLFSVGLALVFSTLVSVSVLATPLDIAGPRTSGTVFAMTNTIASVPGFWGVKVVGELRQCCGWRIAFASCSCLYVVAAIIYWRFGTAKRLWS